MRPLKMLVVDTHAKPLAATTKRAKINQTIQKLNSLPPLRRVWRASQILDYMDGLPNEIDGTSTQTYDEWVSLLPTECVQSHEEELVGA